jgi:hypothetical protein
VGGWEAGWSGGWLVGRPFTCSLDRGKLSVC